MARIIHTKHPAIPTIQPRKRVAAYARVSIEKETMIESLATQVGYYRAHNPAESPRTCRRRGAHSHSRLRVSCGTDPHILHGVWPGGFPLIPGHEASGEIVKLGEGVRKLKVGDRVSVDPNVGCGYCEYCQRGYRAYVQEPKAIRRFFAGRGLQNTPSSVRRTHFCCRRT